jgi:fatty-acyl-CoA synthase
MKLPLTPTRFLNRTAQLYGNKVAIIDGARQFTYREYKERSQRLGHALRDLGLQPGDVVAYLGLNNHQLLEAYYAILPTGLILLPLNVRLRPQDFVYILTDSNAKALIAGPEFADGAFKLKEALPGLEHLILLGEDVPVGAHSYEQMLANASAAEIDYTGIDDDAVAEMFYTSGTTGRPKGVELTHRNLYLHGLCCIPPLGLSDRDVFLVGTVPLFHVNAWGAPHWNTAVGAQMVVTPRFDPEWTLKAIQEHKVTLVALVPTMLNALINYPKLGDFVVSSLRGVVIGGAPPPPSMIAAAREKLGTDCMVGYGLSETTPVLTLSVIKDTLRGEPDEAQFARKAMTGIPILGVELRIVDAEGHDVPADGESMGEIIVRADHVMRGYHNLPEDTARVIVDGWFHTGDLASMDGEGYVQIKDRMKDIIISGGENISSVEIEDVLYQHPAVMEAAVVAAPDEQWGEIPVALVVLRPGHEATAEEILAFCAERLPGFKRPKLVEFVSEFAKTGTGKIIKTELREKYWQGQALRVH